MTIASETSRVDLVGDGINDTFAFTFEIYAKTDISVYVGGVLKTVDIHYTVPIAGIENPDGGNVVFTAGNKPGDGILVAIILNLPLTQLIDYVEADKFPAETHERGLDRLVKIAQQLKEGLSRAPSVAISSALSDLIIPEAASRAIGWDPIGEELTTYPITPVLDPSWDSIQNYDNDLATAVSTIGGGAKTLLIDVPPESVTVNLEVPETLELYPIRTGVITVDNCVLTINKLSKAVGLYKIFNCINGGTVTFGTGAVKEVYPEWWGWSTAASSAVNLAALNAAIACMNSAKIVFSTGTYSIDKFTLAASSLELIGVSAYSGGTIFESESDADVSVLVSGSWNLIHGISFHGNDKATKFHVTGHYNKFDKCHYRYHTDYQIHDSGIQNRWQGGLATNSGCVGATTGVIVIEYNDKTFDGMYINGNDRAPCVILENIDKTSIRNVNLINCELESALGTTVLVKDDVYGLSINNNYFETHAGAADYHVKFEHDVRAIAEITGNDFNTCRYSVWLDRISNLSSVTITDNPLIREMKVDIDYDALADNWLSKMPLLNIYHNGWTASRTSLIELDNDAWEVSEIRTKLGMSPNQWQTEEMEFTSLQLTTTDETETSLFEAYINPGGGTTYPAGAWIEAKVLGRDKSGAGKDINWYHKQAAARNQAADSATLIGAVNTVMEVEEDAAFDCDIDCNLNKVRVRVTGKAATNVMWIGTVTIKMLY